MVQGGWVCKLRISYVIVHCRRNNRLFLLLLNELFLNFPNKKSRKSLSLFFVGLYHRIFLHKSLLSIRCVFADDIDDISIFWNIFFSNSL